MTRGGEGAVVRVTRTGEQQALPAPSVEVVDTVGAGDSFMAGLVSGLLDAGLLGGPAARARLHDAALADVVPAVQRALRAGALTVERAGAYAPTRAVSHVAPARPSRSHLSHAKHARPPVPRPRLLWSRARSSSAGTG